MPEQENTHTKRNKHFKLKQEQIKTIKTTMETKVHVTKITNPSFGPVNIYARPFWI